MRYGVGDLYLTDLYLTGKWKISNGIRVIKI